MPLKLVQTEAAGRAFCWWLRPGSGFGLEHRAMLGGSGVALFSSVKGLEVGRCQWGDPAFGGPCFIEEMERKKGLWICFETSRTLDIGR